MVDSNENLQRSETATTTAAFDVEKGTNSVVGAPYFVSTVVAAGPPQQSRQQFIAAPDNVLEAYRASLSLRCAGIIDCVLCIVSALTWWNLWGILMLLLCPFGLIARHAAATYNDGALLQTYLIYTFFIIIFHCFLGFLLFINFFPFDGTFELFKAAVYMWFSYVAYKLRICLRSVTREDKEKLRTGRFTIARTEQLVYVV